MITLSGWLYLGFLLHHVCARGAYAPADPDTQSGSSDEDVQVYFDENSDTKQSENKPLGYFQDLLTNPKVNSIKQSPDAKSDGSMIPLSPAVPGNKHEKSEDKSKGKSREEDTGIKAQDSSNKGRTGNSNAETDTNWRLADNKIHIPTRRKNYHQPKEESEVVSRQELVTFFSHSSKGTGNMIAGCSLLHFSVRSRCMANVLELTASSRSPVLGQLMLVEGDEQVLMDGAYLVVYAVQGSPSPTTGRLWRLTRELLKSDINFDCINCDNLKVRLLIKAGESTCGIEVSCQQTGGSRLGNAGNRVIDKVHRNPASSPTSLTSPRSMVAPQDPTSAAKTTISLVYGWDMSGADVSGPVGLGTVMSLVVSVYCQDVTIDLHMVKCDAKSEDGTTILLVKDGCSVSHVIGEFREVLGLVHESSFGSQPVRRVTQYARLEAFNTRSTKQMITILCTIKICSGECAEQPACVHSDINLGRSKRPVVSLYSQEVTLGKPFSVKGLSDSPSRDAPSKILRSDDRYDDDDDDGAPARAGSCVSYRTLYILLGFLTGAYLAVLVACVHCVRYATTRAVVRSRMEDYESPSRPLYADYSSPRKRTPKASSPEYSTFAMSADERNDVPEYRRHL